MLAATATPDIRVGLTRGGYRFLYSTGGGRGGRRRDLHSTRAGLGRDGSGSGLGGDGSGFEVLGHCHADLPIYDLTGVRHIHTARKPSRYQGAAGRSSQLALTIEEPNGAPMPASQGGAPAANRGRTILTR
jgi:hypothetical protein